MAPENEAGLNEEVDQRPADFYAFAKIIWATLVGRQPFPRERQREVGSRLADLLGDMNFGPLDRVCDQLLRTDPRVRLGDWGLVIAELEATDRLIQDVPARLETRRDSLRAALRVGALPIVLAEVTRRSSSQDRAEWLGQAVSALRRSSEVIEPQLVELTAATGSAIRLSLNIGGEGLTDVVRIAPSAAPSELDLSRADQPPLGGAPLLLRINAQSQLPIGELRIGAHVALVGTEVWALSVPYLVPVSGPMAAPQWLLDRYLHAIGPLPALRATTLDQLRKFGATVATDFLDMSRTYLEAVADGLDPLEARNAPSA